MANETLDAPPNDARDPLVMVGGGPFSSCGSTLIFTSSSASRREAEFLGFRRAADLDGCSNDSFKL